MFRLRQRLHDEGKPEAAPSDPQHYRRGRRPAGPDHRQNELRAAPDW